MEKRTASKVETRRGKPAPTQTTSTAPGGGLDAESRRGMIAEAAYYLAEKRGFAPGSELEDWCEAESRIDQQAAGGIAH